MIYLLIFFILAVVLSPVAMMRSSPGQQKASVFRQQARRLGFQVQLVPDIEADEEVKKPDSVRYLLPFANGESRQCYERWGSWTLTRGRRRGWQSPWSEWNWFRQAAEEANHGAIGQLLGELPDNVYGVRGEKSGIALYLHERGDENQLESVAKAVRAMLAG